MTRKCVDGAGSRAYCDPNEVGGFLYVRSRLIKLCPWAPVGTERAATGVAPEGRPYGRLPGLVVAR